jgi:uncharacterized protein (TIGR02452 family)
VKVSFLVTDTISAALQACNAGGDGRVGVLNMASPLRPGGGFLQGATSQEEFLCGCTTLYPSLQENFYRLPELGAVWSPDVLIFRDGSQEANDLGKSERRYVGVVSAGMLRFPELQDGEETYASAKDAEMVEKKMRAVMRIFQSKGMATVILGAWGCGAYGNPVRAVAGCCKKVLLGGKRGSDESETWDPVKEVIFAINDRRMAEEFAGHFGSEVMAAEDDGKTNDGEEVDESVHELEDRIAALEIQIPLARSELLKSRLEEILAGLKQQLNSTDAAES